MLNKLKVKEVSFEQILEDRDYLKSQGHNVVILTEESLRTSRMLCIVLEKCIVDDYKTVYLVGKDK